MKVVIAIAVEEYADARMAAVPFAAADAAALAKALEQHGFSPADRVLLLNEQATKSSIESKVKRTFKQLTANDELILYYAGHGFSIGGASYLTGSDTDPDDLVDTSIPLSWLSQQLRNSRRQSVALFLDASHGGLTSTGDGLDIDALNEAELEELFRSGDRATCFVACKAGESSRSSDALQHGIWAHHLIEAFDGRAPAALTKGAVLTPKSLQKYLKQAVGQTLTKTFATKQAQTPWMIGVGDGQFPLAELTDVLAKRKATAHPSATQIKNVAFVRERLGPVKGLSGYKKTYDLPDRVNAGAQAFIAKISREEITGDINGVFTKLKSAFKFKRADMDLTDPGEGAATIITPYFNYSITIELSKEDLSQVVVRRTVDAIKEPEQLLSDQFSAVFEGVFDSIHFDAPKPIDLVGLIDRIEELEINDISVDYDPGATHCTLHVKGIAAAITVTPSSLSIVHARPDSPKRLLDSFFQIQRALVEQHDVRLIPFEKST